MRTADRATLLEETRRAAKEVASAAAQEAQDAAIKAYQKQEDELRLAQAQKRKEAAEKAKQTKAQRIESLQQWLPPFVMFVRRLAEPFFAEWNLDAATLDRWAVERSEVYTKQKPYVLEIVRAIHADAERAARSYANLAQKSESEIARGRAKAVADTIEKNSQCPYCDQKLDETAHLDHIIPVQRGGPSVPWNLVFCCVPCNFAKRDLSLAEFAVTDYARKKALDLTEIVERLASMGKYSEVSR